MALLRLKTWSWMALIGMLILPAASRAETVYVSDDFEIAIRSGPAADRKIIAMVKSGKELELVEKGDEWSMVRTPNGKEGWAPNRYLTSTQPSALVLERVTHDYDVLSSKYKDLKGKFDQLEALRKGTDADLSQSRRKQDELSLAYETLKKESSDFLKMKQRNQEMAAELDVEKARSAELNEENLRMQRDSIIQWVLTGSGIMLTGFLMGIFSSNRRKPRSSLY